MIPPKRSIQEPIAVWIDSVGLVGPGLPDWSTARAVLRGERDWQHEAASVTLPPILPPAERRRTSLAVRIALAAIAMSALLRFFPEARTITVLAAHVTAGAAAYFAALALLYAPSLVRMLRTRWLRLPGLFERARHGEPERLPLHR